MEYVETNDIKQFQKLYIGKGRTACVFRISKYYVAKIFYEDFQRDVTDEELEEFELLSKITNDTYIGPTKLIICDNRIVGYIYPYIKGITFHRYRNIITIDAILKEYEKMLADTILVSEMNFRLFDLHGKNIIYNRYHHFKIIDLDKGGINHIFTKEELIGRNTSTLNTAIINTLLKVYSNQAIDFYNCELNGLYYNLSDVNNFYELLNRFQKISNCSSSVRFRKIKRRIYYGITDKYGSKR